MAWHCSGKSNSQLAANLKSRGIIHSEQVYKAMNKVDRANYVASKEDAYEDSPQIIGYGATISAPHMHATPLGKVVGIDHIPELVKGSVVNLKKDGRGNAIDKGEIEMITEDGRLGYHAGGPYDMIHVGAAAPIMPQVLIDQLASPGRMFIPVGTGAQHIEHVDKDENGMVIRSRVMAVRYVPLTDKDHQI